MDRLLAFLGRLTGLQIWLFVSVPALFAAGLASHWLGDAALWTVFFVVPTAGFVIFYLVPFIGALRKGDGAASLKSGLIALGVVAVVVTGWLASHR